MKKTKEEKPRQAGSQRPGDTDDKMDFALFIFFLFLQCV